MGGFSLGQGSGQITKPRRQASHQVVLRAGGFQCERPAAGAVLSAVVGDTGWALRFLLGTGVGVDALEGQDAVPLPPVEFVDANPLLLGLWVGENSIPAQALVGLVRKFLS